MTNTPNAGLRRRTFVVAAFGLALPAAAPRAVAAPARTNQVNLYSQIGPVVIGADGTGIAEVVCGNFGPDDARGPVSLKFVLPPYFDVPALPAVPGACVDWLHHDTAVDVPSVFRVRFPRGIKAGTTKAVSFTAVLDDRCPAFPPSGRAVFSTDPGNTCDVDIDTSRDAPTVRPVRSTLTTPPPGTANLAFSHRSFPLVAGGDAVKIPFSFVNLAGSCTRHPARFTFFTPYHCDIPAEGRPPGLTALYENTSDPTIPSVYQLEIPPGLTGRPHTVEIPFRIAVGAPVGPMKAQGIIVPTGTDTQGDLSTAHRKFGLMSVTAGAVKARRTRREAPTRTFTRPRAYTMR